MSDKIKNIHAREILAGFGYPTIETTVLTDNGYEGKAAVPRGTSVGKYEAKQIFDKEERYEGYGMKKAVGNVNQKIGPRLAGTQITNQRKIDKELIKIDGTANKSNLGANATLGVSLAAAIAGARSSKLPLFKYLGGFAPRYLPAPVSTVLQGGRFSDSRADFEDYFFIPLIFDHFEKALEALSASYHSLGKVLAEKAYVSNHGAYNLKEEMSTPQIFELMLKAIRKAGFEDRIFLGLDIVGADLYDEEKEGYMVQDRVLSPDELIEYLRELREQFPLIFLEDPFREEDFENFARLNGKTGKTLIVGDDLFASNLQRVKKGIEQKSANGLLLKLSQAGTVTEAQDAGSFALRNDMEVAVSMRSKDTINEFKADFAVALGAPMAKFGPPIGAEKVVKYNRLLEIDRKNPEIFEFSGNNISEKLSLSQ